MKKKRGPAMGDFMDWVDRFVAWHDEPPEPVPPSEYTDTSKLAELFNVRPWNDILQEIWPELTASRKAFIEKALEAGHSEEEAYHLADEETYRMIDEVRIPWYQDLMDRANEAFNRFHLDLEREPSGSYKIQPAEGKTWADAAEALTYSLHDWREPHKNELRMIKKKPSDWVLRNLRDIARWKYRDIR